MTIEYWSQHAVAIIKLNGQLGRSAKRSVRRQLRSLFHQGHDTLILDLQAVHSVDVCGLGVIVDMLHRVRARGGDLILINLTRVVRHILELTQLDRLVRIVEQPLDAARLDTASLMRDSSHVV